MEPSDGPKEETRPRRRRRSSDSVISIALEDAPARGSSAGPCRAELTPSEEHNASLAPILLDTIEAQIGPSPATTTRSPAETSSTGPSPGRYTGKRRASGEMIHREESKTMQSTRQGSTPGGSEIRRPDLPKQAVVSPTVHTVSEVETPQQQDTQENQPHTSNLPLRVSTRRTTTTTRWSPSMPGGPRERASRTARGSTAKTATPPARPISNATRNVSFGMLQPHFERPLQQAADSFGVCTTLLKKICRRNGISNWPYRKICGLRKSIASMAKQVNYFDGEQRRAYADQLEKLEHELQAYLRTGNEPTEEFLRMLRASTSTQQQNQSEAHAAEISHEDDEKEAQAVPSWTARPSIAVPLYIGGQIVYPTQEVQAASQHLPAPGMSVNTWRPPGPSFPTIATHHRALPSIASILQHQSYSSPSRAASTQNPNTVQQYEVDQQQQWQYFPPTNGNAV
ncbi:RWP-RK domain [Phytophthora infestans]|uniref:RWP-RK domain n=1 Tax=Phytophthora infestans TaxID=4787 RepID=A0A833W6S1_PHYIN|nr:RWP-RK domain [Phytophthora infestans]KAF4140101.1 RWP-RK domain [Phytophthora infestans]